MQKENKNQASYSLGYVFGLAFICCCKGFFYAMGAMFAIEFIGYNR